MFSTSVRSVLVDRQYTQGTDDALALNNAHVLNTTLSVTWNASVIDKNIEALVTQRALNMLRCLLSTFLGRHL